jgi:hypothetical protein
LTTALVTVVDPASDSLFADPEFERIVFAGLKLDPLSFVSGKTYDFSTQTYLDGVRLFDDDNTLLMTADLTVDAMILDRSTGSINPSFGMNLSNIVAGAEYQHGSSPILDAFVGAPGGSLNLTLQIPNSNLGGIIENGGMAISTYSGSLAPVPEPSTLLLLGAGLLGLVAFRRKQCK